MCGRIEKSRNWWAKEGGPYPSPVYITRYAPGHSIPPTSRSPEHIDLEATPFFFFLSGRSPRRFSCSFRCCLCVYMYVANGLFCGGGGRRHGQVTEESEHTAGRLHLFHRGGDGARRRIWMVQLLLRAHFSLCHLSLSPSLPAATRTRHYLPLSQSLSCS
jgi:hypothetical protein